MALNNSKPKKPILSLQSSLSTTLFFIVLFTIPALLLLHTPTASICTTLSQVHPWSGDLREAEFAWNRLQFIKKNPPRAALKIAVFSRKWPVGATPGGMERHAHTLHTALAHRGHQVHVFTSPLDDNIPNAASQELKPTGSSPFIHCHEGEPGRWRYNKAWEQFEEENKREPFDVVHSESVALPHWLARQLPNLAVSWHGIALESVQSSIFQDLARPSGEPISPSFNRSLQGVIPKVLNEIRFFKNYKHHVAISDSCGEMLRDVYQIPSRRVHVIVNGVNEDDFREDLGLGLNFRASIGVPSNASLVLGVAGRLVKDKGHPLLYEAFSILKAKHPDVYLVVAGAGPWQQRYMDLGSQVIVLGSMNPSQLRAFYNAIDIFVNPTLRPQGLDLTLMEAMMSGKPVMASRFPSIRGTIVVDDEFGYMFAPNVESLSEALEAVVAEGSERLSRRGKACRAYAASMFTASKMALAYERTSSQKQQKTRRYPENRDATPPHKRREIAFCSHANHGSGRRGGSETWSTCIRIVDERGEDSVDKRADRDVGDENVVVDAHAVGTEQLGRNRDCGCEYEAGAQPDHCSACLKRHGLSEDAASKKKATGVGTSATANHPVLAK